MNIHLVNDEKFINLSVERFNHYYPDRNIFFVESTSANNYQLKHVTENNFIKKIDLTDTNSIEQILPYCDKNCNIFIHYLTEDKSIIVNLLKEKTKAKTYWIFYGADMFRMLYTKGLYKLYDRSTVSQWLFHQTKKLMFKFRILPAYVKAKEKCIEQMDYFCFWNYHDYEILKNKLKTKAEFKYFRYYEAPVMDYKVEKKEPGSILLNHSSSRSGNHITILEKLKRIDTGEKLKKVYSPLGYPEENVKASVIKYGIKHLSYCFEPMTDFIPKAKYHDFLKTIEVAIFGHRRQEGGANIFFLLATGCKIFLRKESNLFKYLKDRGYHIYDFDNDLNSIDDLQPLAMELFLQNKHLVIEEFSLENVDSTYQNLI